jgi:poly(3-hydroxybutyrate) depolymerase
MNATAGTHSFDISKYYHSANAILVKASIGRSEVTLRCIPFSNWGYALHRGNTESAFSNSQRFTAVDEVVDTIIDTIKVTATGYKPKSVPITSLGDQEINITLKANNEKDDPTPSCGCGKPLDKISRSGTYNITSAGRNRSFIIDIPSNYDKNKPYRLIFAMHCMGSSAQGTVNENYYNLKTQAERAGIQCIFVAPQGNSNGTWGGDYEHTFVADMLKLFKENLCIDTSRIFSCGFSFGAMFTYSLSLSFQNDLRAVATYAPANYNIWLPTNKRLPIAYLQISGTGDQTCPWVNNEGARQGGKFCVLTHAEDNGCNIPGNIPTPNGGQRVTTEFEGCRDGYPVRVIVHSGGHDWQMTEQGTKYAPVETWDFFMRF